MSSAQIKENAQSYRGRNPLPALNSGTSLIKDLPTILLAPDRRRNLVTSSTGSVIDTIIQNFRVDGRMLTDSEQLPMYADFMFSQMLRALKGDLKLRKLTSPREALGFIRSAGWEGMQAVIANSVDELGTLQRLHGIFMDTAFKYISPDPESGEEKLLPFSLDQEQAEFVITECARLVTDGPLMDKIVRKLNDGDAMPSKSLAPVFQKLAEGVQGMDKGALGLWFSHKGKSRTPATNMIMQIASDVVVANSLAEAKPSTVNLPKGPEDKALQSFVARIESILDKQVLSDKTATQELRRLVLHVFELLSPEAVIEQVLATGDDEIVKAGWFKHMFKILRDPENPSQEVLVKNKVKPKKKSKREFTVEVLPETVTEVGATVQIKPIEEEPSLGPLYTNFDDIGSAVGMIDNDVRIAAAKALCGPLIDVESIVGAKSPLAWDMAPMLLQWRRTTLLGRPLLSVPRSASEQVALTQNEAELSKTLSLSVQTLGRLIGQTVEVANATAQNDRFMTMNRPQRVVYLIDLFSRVLAVRPHESERVKEAARIQFGYTMLANFLNMDNMPEIIQNAIRQSIKTIGLKWPKDHIENLVVQYQHIMVNRGREVRPKLLEFAEILGVANWEEIINPTSALAGNPRIEQMDGMGKQLMTTDARPALVQAQTIVIKDPDLYTGSKLDGPREENETLLRELSHIHFMWNIHDLSERVRVENNPALAIKLAEALRYYYARSNGREVQNLNTLLDRVTPTQGTTGKLIKIGSARFFDFSIPETERHPEIKVISVEDMRQLAGAGDMVWQYGMSMLDQNFRVVKRFAIPEEKSAFIAELVAQIEHDLAWTLKNDSAVPTNMREQIKRTQERIFAIRKNVQASFKSMMANNGFFDGSQELQAMLKEAIGDNALFEEVWAQVGVERENLDTLIKETAKSTIKPIRKDVKDLTTFAATQIATTFNALMTSAQVENMVPLSQQDVIPILKGLTAAKGEELTMATVGDMIREALAFLGAAGFGFAMGNGYQAKADLAKHALKTSERPMAAILKMNDADAQAYMQSRSRLITAQIEVMDSIFDSRVELLRAMEEKVDGAKRESIADAINTMRALNQRQHTQLRKTVNATMDVIDQIGQIQLDVMALDLREAKASKKWLIRFMDEVRPTIRGLQRIFEEVYGFRVELETWADVDKLFPLQSNDVPEEALIETAK